MRALDFNLFWFRSGWLFHSGDDPAFADPALDDSAWTPVDSRLLDPPPSWDGLGWLRLHLDVAPDVDTKDIMLTFRQSGASEIYLDGRYLAGFGTVGADPQSERVHLTWEASPVIPIPLVPGARHVLAVRYANRTFHHSPILRLNLGLPPGFGAGLDPLPSISARRAWIVRTTTSRQMLWGMPFALALLHALIFALHRGAREHLYGALFAGATAGLVYFPFVIGHWREPSAFAAVVVLFEISLVGCAWFGLLAVHHILRGRPPRYAPVLKWAAPAAMLLTPLVPTVAYYALTLAGFFEMLRVVVLAVRDGRPGSRIVGVGCAALTLGSFVQVLFEVEVLEFDFSFPYVYGVIALAVSMSIHLARKYARTHEDLESRLDQIETLTDVTLAQERQAREHEAELREQEARRRLLEIDNAARARALEEAERRQQALDALEAANRELRDARARLVQTERMAAIGNLVAGIAHDINTPVGAVGSSHDTLVRATDRLSRVLAARHAGLLADDGPPAVALRVIGEANHVIRTAIDRINDIIRSLRNFARLDEAEMKRADLHEGLDSTLTLVHHHLKRRIRVVRDYGRIPPVLCYPGRLNQVFLNLLVNAAQAIDGEGAITISTRAEGSTVRICIADTGRGIPPEHLSRIFDSGYTTKKPGEGTGLGLSISRQIVHDHRGTIDVESAADRGTVFTVVLPVG
jgi:signal transduction histidine kinase